MPINNLPADYRRYPYIVARCYEGERWFWGAFYDRNRANEAALEEGGETWDVALVERGRC